MNLQSAIHFLYPPRCIACGVETTTDFALCGPCWRETAFVSGLVCTCCGCPLPGDDSGEGVLCDSCLAAPLPWVAGRAALLYEGTAQRMVIALKHGDRQELVAPLAAWMADKAGDLDIDGAIIAPVPLHRRRLFTRRFNQAALLAKIIARRKALAWCPDLLKRTKTTAIHKGLSREERFENQRGAFVISANRTHLIDGHKVLLVDDVMTTGATLSACTEACYAAGADLVNVLVLARVARGA